MNRIIYGSSIILQVHQVPREIKTQLQPVPVIAFRRLKSEFRIAVRISASNHQIRFQQKIVRRDLHFRPHTVIGPATLYHALPSGESYHGRVIDVPAITVVKRLFHQNSGKRHGLRPHGC